jgi:hypothetical protein
MGDECSYVSDLEETLAWAYGEPRTEAIYHAIRLCRSVLRLPRLPSDLRGDFAYQTAHKETNLKKKRAWLANKNGSWYDDYAYDLAA